MEIAVLTARLEAQTSAFLAGMKTVQTQIDTVDRTVKKLEKAVAELNVALKGVHLDSSDASKTEIAADREVRALHKIRDAALEASAAESRVNNISGSINGSFRGPGGRFVSQTDKQAEATARMAAAARGGSSGGYYDAGGRLRGPGGQFMSMGGATPMGAATSVAGRATYGSGSYGMGGTIIRDSDEFLRQRREAAQAQRLYANEVRNLQRNRGLGSSSAIPMGSAMADRLTAFGGGRTNFIDHYMRSFGDENLGSYLPSMSRGRSAADYLASKGFKDAESVAVGGGLFGGGRNGGRRGGLLSDLYNGGGRYRGNYNVPGLNLLAGVLPGGRRARPAALITGGLLGLATTPSLAPAALGLGAAASSGLIALAGGAATLKLAFADLNAAAFNTQKGFDALNPIQQKFVMSIRDLDKGFVTPLERLASKQVLPGLTAALHSALTPGAAGAIRGGVAAFGGAISGGAQQFGKLFGSAGFSTQFGSMLQQDAGLLRDMFKWATSLADAFVRLSVTAGPLVQWLSKGATSFTSWIDKTIRAKQASGQLAQYFDKARMSLEALGKLAVALINPFRAIAQAIGFGNSLGTIGLLTKLLDDFTARIRQNKQVLHDFFGGALAAAKDMLNVVNGLVKALGPLLSLLNKVVGGMKGWQTVIDSIAVVWVAKIGLMKIALVGLTAEEKKASAGLAGIRGSLIGLAGKVFTIGVILSFIPGNSKGQSVLNQTGGGFLGKLPFGIGAFDQQVASFTNQYVRPLVGEKPLNTSTPAAPNAYTSGGVPKAPSDSDWRAIRAASKAAIAYGNGGSPFVKNKQFTATSQTSVLPIGLQTAIDKAGFSGNRSAQMTAIRNALNWIGSHAGGVKDLSQRDLYYQEGSSLKSQLTSLQGPKPSVLDTVFSPSRQSALAAAVTRYGAHTGSGASPAAMSSAASQLRQAAEIQMKYLQNELSMAGKLNLTDKQRLAIVKELAAVQKDITRAANEQVKAAKALKAEEHKTAGNVLNKAFGSFLGLGGDGSTNAVGVRTRERTTLLGIVRGLSPHLKAGQDPLGAIPGAAHMSITALAHALRSRGALSERGLKDILGIDKFAGAFGKAHLRIDPTNLQQITALLTQIKDNTAKAVHPSNFHVPSAKEIGAMTGIKNPRARAAAVQRLLSYYAHGGEVPGGPYGEGLPVSGGVQGGMRRLPLLHGNITINIHSNAKDPKEVAKEVERHLQAAGRRNPTQTRGPNAGRNRGLN